MEKKSGITLDLYRTLIEHRDGGRGELYQQYLVSKGLSADAWEHQVLYDVFAFYADAYVPDAADAQKLQFWVEFTNRLFQRTGVSPSKSGDAAEHAGTIRDIFGPGHFRLYPEVRDVLHVNGEVYGPSGSYNGTIRNDPQVSIYLGENPAHSGLKRAFHGDVDEVIMWNRGLSWAEMRQLYNSQK